MKDEESHPMRPRCWCPRAATHSHWGLSGNYPRRPFSDCDRHLTHICWEPFWEKNKIAARVGVGQNYSRFLVRQAEGNHRTGSKDEGSSIKCEEQLVLNLNRVFKSEQRAILQIWSAWFKTTQMPGGRLITVRLTCPLQELCGWWRCMGRASYVLDTEN